jgi:hypothetical protein
LVRKKATKALKHKRSRKADHQVIDFSVFWCFCAFVARRRLLGWKHLLNRDHDKTSIPFIADPFDDLIGEESL